MLAKLHLHTSERVSPGSTIRCNRPIHENIINSMIGVSLRSGQDREIGMSSVSDRGLLIDEVSVASLMPLCNSQAGCREHSACAFT